MSSEDIESTLKESRVFPPPAEFAKKAHVKSLAEYKVPHIVEFRGELPKTDVGKISRRELRDESTA